MLEPGRFVASRRLIVELETRSGLAELNCPLTMQLHTATTSCSARLLSQRPPGGKEFSAKQSVVAVVETEQPIIAVWGQRFLVRLPYPIGTFGGGRILAAMMDSKKASPRTKHLVEFGEKLQSPQAVERLMAWVDEVGEVQASEPWLETAIGLIASDPTQWALEKQHLIDAAVQSGRLLCLEQQHDNQPILLSATAVTRASDQILKALQPGQKAAASRTPDNIWRAEASVIEQLKGLSGGTLLRYAIDDLVRRGRLIRLSNMIAVAGDDQMTARQRQTLDAILELYENNRTPPTHSEAAATLSIPETSLRSLSRFACNRDS